MCAITNEQFKTYFKGTKYFTVLCCLVLDVYIQCGGKEHLKEDDILKILDETLTNPEEADTYMEDFDISEQIYDAMVYLKYL